MSQYDEAQPEEADGDPIEEAFENGPVEDFDEEDDEDEDFDKEDEDDLDDDDLYYDEDDD